MKYFNVTFLIFTSLTITACAHKKPAGDGKTYLLEMKARPGEVQLTRYFSHANIKSFEDRQLIRDKQEMVDFTVRSEAMKADSDRFSVKIRTIRKDGTAPLHELAFPELNEEILLVMNRQAKILSAGDYPPESLFFVPFMPIPKGPVEIGETWTLEHSWISNPSGIPLDLDIIAILKNVVPCGKNHSCADVEISGKVIVAAMTRADVKFDGKVWGRILFNLEQGDVMWSETRSSEQMTIGKDRMQVTSCLRSEFQDPKVKPSKRDGFKCTPSEDPVEEPKVKI